MNYTVIGAARSGLAAAVLAKKLGHNVFVTESKTKEFYPESVKSFGEFDIDSEFGENTEKAFKNVDTIITSPGVLPSTWIISEADKRGIPVISELEFASQHLKNKMIAITGTNGKTTTTTLTSYILNNGGKKAVTAGNIGTPLSALVGNVHPDTIIVCEVSSFQLDRIVNFRPDVAMILNITPDHLYYHGNYDEYIKAKWKICANQYGKDLLILNNDDSALVGGFVHTKGIIARFSFSPVESGIYIADGKMVMRYPDLNNEEVIMLIDEIRLPGTHNAYNSMAAALAARAFEVRNENIRDSLMAFEGVEHRLEYVRTLNGVDYVNDSKATNVNATWYGLSSYKQPIVWIAGGRGDSNDYLPLDELVQKNVKAIICIGEEADNIFNHYCTTVRCIKSLTFEEAINTAKDNAEFGDVVLFTPACKSFDMFMNYEQRGEVFKEIVNNL